MALAPTAADIIARLALKPHPEGGHFRETFRDARLDASGRSVSTAICFCWRVVSVRTGTASTPSMSGIFTREVR
jgi:predicted cupin superfamily sugar epimerase